MISKTERGWATNGLLLLNKWTSPERYPCSNHLVLAPRSNIAPFAVQESLPGWSGTIQSSARRCLVQPSTQRFRFWSPSTKSQGQCGTFALELSRSTSAFVTSAAWALSGMVSISFFSVSSCSWLTLTEPAWSSSVTIDTRFGSFGHSCLTSLDFYFSVSGVIGIYL